MKQQMAPTIMTREDGLFRGKLTEDTPAKR